MYWTDCYVLFVPVLFYFSFLPLININLLEERKWSNNFEHLLLKQNRPLCNLPLCKLTNQWNEIAGTCLQLPHCLLPDSIKSIPNWSNNFSFTSQQEFSPTIADPIYRYHFIYETAFRFRSFKINNPGLGDMNVLHTTLLHNIDEWKQSCTCPHLLYLQLSKPIKLLKGMLGLLDICFHFYSTFQNAFTYYTN